MDAKTGFTVPVRPDLAGVEPHFYPIVEHKRFGSIKAMCKYLKLPETEAQNFTSRAEMEQSNLVVLDNLFLGDPEERNVAVLLLSPGSVMLCAGLFSEMSRDRDDIEALCAELATRSELEGRFIAIGEFRPNPAGSAH